MLEICLAGRWVWFVRHHSAAGELWNKVSSPVRYYLLCRAADHVSFGERYAGLPASTFPPYEEVVGALVSLSNDTKARHDAAEEKEKAAREKQRIEKECAEHVGRISYNPPAILEAGVLSGSESQDITQACVNELCQDQNTRSVAATIDEFAKFCGLLGKPENHILVASGQYVQGEVNTRTVADMTNEMAQELVKLPRFTAYAKVIASGGGEEQWTVRKIRALKPLDMFDESVMDERERVIEENTGPFYVGREQIEEQISQRQQKSRMLVGESLPPIDRRVEELAVQPRPVAVVEPDEPPPMES